MRRSRQHLQSTIFDRAGANLREFESGVQQALVQKANAIGHFSVIF
jgi:hypothetical protein